MNMTNKIIISGLLLVLTIATGLLLSGIGRPLNIALNTVHKLIALGFTVYTAFLAAGLLKSLQVSAFLLIVAIATAIFVIALFATGAILSSDKPAAGIVLTIHRIAPALVTLSTALMIYLMVKK